MGINQARQNIFSVCFDQLRTTRNGDVFSNINGSDAVTLNDDRHTSLTRFRRLTSVDLSIPDHSNQHPTLPLVKLMEASNGGYVNQSMVITEEGSGSSDVKLPIEDTLKGSEIAVDVRDVTFTYGFGKKSVITLKKMNVCVPQGKIYALLGSSGCGMKNNIINHFRIFRRLQRFLILFNIYF